MATLYLDCFSGISGDMFLGALVHHGLSLADLRGLLAGFPLPLPDIEAETVSDGGIGAVRLHVAQGEPTRRTWKDIREMLQRARLEAGCRQRAMKVFSLLAAAEARVHGCGEDEVHFHEVGGLDAIVDIVGVVGGLHLLGIDSVYSSPLPLGRGWVRAAHGMLPLPAPAVVELLAGVPVVAGIDNMELVTPTGAALVVGLAAGFGPIPAMRLSGSGYGAGSRRRPDGNPNLLRILIGETEPRGESREIEVIETNIDDLAPEICAHAAERLLAAGALDVSWSPLTMKKGRPALLLRVLADPARGEVLRRLILAETTAIGLRYRREQRMTLGRRQRVLATPWGDVEVKEVETPGGLELRPEYESCRQLALAAGVPLRRVYDAVTRAAAGDSGEKGKCG